MSLEHPNVVPIYDAGDVDGRVYLAMRLVDGIDLRSLLRSEGALEPARAIAICAQIAAALDAAHARGLVHRDVKPSNVLLDGSEHVYLADFGLTRRLDDDEAQAGEGSSDRHARLPRARAARRRADRRQRRRLLARLRALRVPDRRARLPALLPARSRVGAPRGGAAEAEQRAAGAAGGDRRRHRAGVGEGARPALSELRGAGRCRRTGTRARNAAGRRADDEPCFSPVPPRSQSPPQPR